MAKKSGIEVQIDGDGIVYRCGFAVEKTVHTVMFKGEEMFTSESAKEAKEFIAKQPKRRHAHMEIETSANIEPLRNALHSAKITINKILEATKADTYVVHLSCPGAENFRMEIDPNYKANRSEDNRPFYYEKIRQYLIDVHNAKVADKQEADDAMGIAQVDRNTGKLTKKGSKSVIASFDKDMKTIPGWHYDWTKEDAKLVWISKEEALRNFYMQVLTGDAVDNVKGLPNCAQKTREEFGLTKRAGCGPKAAEAILDGANDEKILCQRCYEAYFNYLREDDAHGSDEDAMHAAQALLTRNARLVYIRHHENEMWEIPKR